MAKRKQPPQSIPHKQPKASVEKSNRKLWGLLAVAVISLIIALGGLYVESQCTIPESQQPIKASSQATETVTPQQTPSQKSDIRRGSQGDVKWETQETNLKDGRALRVFSMAIQTWTAWNVRRHGAKGNGSTDDSAAISTLNTDLIADDGGYIWFPPGTYRISNSITIGSTMVQPRFAPGASLSIDVGVTVTMPIPAAGNYQIFSGNGSVSFSGISGTYSPTWFGVAASATPAVNSAAWSSFMSAIPAGAHVRMHEGSFVFAGEVDIDKACLIEGSGPTTIFNFTMDSTDQGLRINASDVHIKHMKVQGPQKASRETTQVGIRADGTNVSSYLTGIKLENLTINNWGGSGTQIRFCNNWYVQDCEVFDCYSNGIQVLQSNYGHIARNYVHGIIGDGVVGTEVYGIAITKNNGTEADFPVPHDTDIVDNIVRDCRTWEGIDTHGGFNLTVRGNRVLDCLSGIVMGPYIATGGSERAASYCTITDNIIRNNHGAGEIVTESDQRRAILMNGHLPSGNKGEGNIIANNTIGGFGDNTATIGNAEPAIELQYQDGIAVKGNVIRNSGRVGIGFFSCVNMTISDNVIETVSGTAADKANGTIQFGANPSDGDTITLNGAVFTYRNAPSGNFEIQIGANLVATLDTTVTDLQAHLDGRVSLATYTEDDVDTLTITFDTIGNFGTSYILAASAATASGANLAQGANVRGSCGIHNKNLSNGPASTGMIANNIFDIAGYTGIQMESDALNLFLSNNRHSGTGPLADCNGSGTIPQSAVRRIHQLGDIRFSQNVPSIADNASHTIYVPMPGMSSNSSVVVTPTRDLQGLTLDVVPQNNYFEVILNNETGAAIDIDATATTGFVCYVNHNILSTVSL